jgi:molecular chaperone DnaK
MPAVGGMLERVSSRKPSREVHPDEAVALGAAVQAALLARTMEPPARPSSTGGTSELTEAETGIREVNVIDVTAHSLGVVLLNLQRNELYNNIVIDRGTQLPTLQEISVNCVADNQTWSELKLAQGEDRDLRYVKVIGEGKIEFAPKPRGYPMVIRVSYDADGLIHAHVFDGVSKELLGELHINRDSNLDAKEREAMRNNVIGLTLG